MKIAVAGAGHGGITAAALLAKEGHDVTVYEKRGRSELGHDWEDRFTFSLLTEILGTKELPADIWRFRGDCAFVSPSYRTEVIIRYTDENRQKIMWRKPVINLLLDFAENNGVKLNFSTSVLAPLTEGDRVTGLKTSSGDVKAELVIDAAGVFSPVRTGLPENFAIEKSPERGDVFYAWRGYFNKTERVMPEVPFEVYLCHNGEQGLSWCCTNEDSVDVLIGRIDPLSDEVLNRNINGLREKHTYIGNEILHGGSRGVIPVRRPLSLMVAEGYAAVGDSAFMTTPMNGMGIDLSLLSGELLAKKIIANNSVALPVLWEYNRDFHRLYGGVTAKNEGLKNSLLQMPPEGVDFLFDNAVIQSSDLAGAGQNTKLGSLLGKFVRGMRKPGCFFAILDGLIKGAGMAKVLKNAPESWDAGTVKAWQNSVESKRVVISRK